MTGLPGEIEEKFALFNERGHHARVTNVRKIDSHLVANVVNVEKISTVFRNQTVDQGDLGAELDQTPGQGGTDKTDPTGDQDVGAGKNVKIPGHGRIVG